MYLFWLLLLQMNVFVGTQKLMFLEYDLTDEEFRVDCTVDRLIHNVVFILSNTSFGYAHCVPPTILTKFTGETCFCECLITPNCTCNVTQNLVTKTTTLLFKGSELTKMNGIVICQHGSHSKSIKIKNECYSNNKSLNKCSNDEGDEPINIWRICTLSLVAVFLCFVIWWVKRYVERKVDSHRKTKCQSCLKRTKTIPFNDDDQVRIYGLCFLTDGTFLAIDRNNYKLIAIDSKYQQLKEQLDDEPYSMTAMTGNEIALTFPYKHIIRMYKINLTTTTIISNKDEPNIIDKISVQDLRTCKPFNIAYNRGYFAVEVGEDEDGMILIIEICQKRVIKKIKGEFAYFTGHTIRLGLKMFELQNNETVDGRLFVSAMSINMVSCLNFNSEKQWHISDPSPRSIIVPDDDSLGENIILSSRRSNTIYQLNQKDGNYKSLKVKDNLKINSPRYIAYHSITRRLCALEKEQNKDGKYVNELVFYEFQDPEQNESSPLVQVIVEDTRV